MISLEIIDLLPENQRPEILAKELNHVEGIAEPWSVAGESGLKGNGTG